MIFYDKISGKISLVRTEKYVETGITGVYSINECDTRFSVIGHDHDSIYYHKYEVYNTGETNLLFSNTSHTHNTSYYLKTEVFNTGETDAIYAQMVHNHNTLYYLKTEVYNTGETNAIYSVLGHTHNYNVLTNTSHTHSINDIQLLSNELSYRSLTSHTHNISSLSDVSIYSAKEFSFIFKSGLTWVDTSNNFRIINNSVFLGLDTMSNSSYTNVVCLGYNANVTGNDQVQLGNNSTTVYAYGTIQTRSDMRDKKEIEDLNYGINFIRALKPVSFKYNYGNRPHFGFIAQDVKKTIDKLHFDFGGFQHHSVNGGEDIMSIGYTEFIAPLVKSEQQLDQYIQQHAKILDNNNQRMLELENSNEEKNNTIKTLNDDLINIKNELEKSNSQISLLVEELKVLVDRVSVVENKNGGLFNGIKNIFRK